MTQYEALKLLSDFFAEQSQKDGPDAPWVDMTDPLESIIDGRIDLMELAKRIANAV